jgi:NADH-quinone oxidoreductase subunit J
MNPFPLAEYLIALLFAFFLAVTIAGAVLAVLTKWIIRSVCGLAMASVGLAGMFYFLNSPFIAMIQILIYVGAVCITIVFAIMLAEPDEPLSEIGGRSLAWTLGALVVAVGVFWALARVGLTGNWPTPVLTPVDGTVEMIGVALLSQQGLAFEAIALVLLVAILGALAIARKGRHMP